MKATAVEVEVHGPLCESLIFAPLQRSVRGYFDMMQVPEPMAKVEASNWSPIPGQRIGVTPDGDGFVKEPLHDPEHAVLKEKIEAKGWTLDPPVQEYPKVHLPTWYFWLQKSAEAKLVKVVSGQFPKDLGGEKPQMNFVLSEPPPGPTDRLANAIEKLLDKLSK